MDNMIDRFGQIPPQLRKATGRARVLTDEQLLELWEMRRARPRVPLTECAKKFGVHVGTICRYLTPALKQKLENLRADRLGEPRTN